VIAEAPAIFKQLLDSTKYDDIRDFIPEFPKTVIDLVRKDFLAMIENEIQIYLSHL